MKKFKNYALILFSAFVLIFSFSLVTSNQVKADLNPEDADCFFDPLAESCPQVSFNCICFDVTP